MDKKINKQFITNQEKKLKSEKTQSLKQIEELKKNDPFADPDHASDNAAVDTDAREQIGHQTIEAQIITLEKRIADIDLAVTKIAKGTYGYCEKCNEQIPLPRLELIPEARYCVKDESKLRK